VTVPTPDPTTTEQGRVCPNCKGEFARLVPCEAGEHTEDHPIYGYTKPCPHPFHHPATPNPDREERGFTREDLARDTYVPDPEGEGPRPLKRADREKDKSQ
jgi:hypothetical protein